MVLTSHATVVWLMICTRVGAGSLLGMCQVLPYWPLGSSHDCHADDHAAKHAVDHVVYRMSQATTDGNFGFYCRPCGSPYSLRDAGQHVRLEIVLNGY